MVWNAAALLPLLLTYYDIGRGFNRVWFERAKRLQLLGSHTTKMLDCRQGEVAASLSFFAEALCTRTLVASTLHSHE